MPDMYDPYKNRYVHEYNPLCECIYCFQIKASETKSELSQSLQGPTHFEQPKHSFKQGIKCEHCYCGKTVANNKPHNVCCMCGNQQVTINSENKCIGY